jgi:cell division inhibitor SepF
LIGERIMDNIFKNFLGYLKLGDDEYEDEDEFDDENDDEDDNNSLIERLKSDQKKDKRQEKVNRREEEKISGRRERGSRMEKTANNKIVPIRTTPKGLEVCIMKPTTFEDSQDICDMLLSGRAAVVNLEGFDPEEAQRIMDFISGCVYAISGKLHQISRYIFIFSPDSIDISGDYLDLIPDSGFGVPTLNKEF